MTPAPAYAMGIMEIWTIIASPDSQLPDAAKSALSSLSEIGDFDQKPTPTNDPGVPNPKPTAELYIAYGQEPIFVDPDQYLKRWYFFTGNYQQTLNYCLWDDVKGADADLSLENPGYPPEEYNIIINGDKCVYKGNADKPGILSCEDLTKDIGCTSLDERHSCPDAYKEYATRVLCQWGSVPGLTITPDSD